MGILNGVCFSITFFKIFLVMECIFHIRIRRKVLWFYLAALCGVAALSVWIDFYQYSVLYAMISISGIAYMAERKKSIGITVLAFIAVSIADMIVSNICGVVLDIRIEDVRYDVLAVMLMYSVTLFMLLIFSAVQRWRGNRTTDKIYQDRIIIYVLIGIVVLFFLIYVQLAGFGRFEMIDRPGFVLGATAIVIAFMTACVMLIENKKKTELLTRQDAMNRSLLKAQKEYYSMLLNREHETKAFRHDMRGHILCMQVLYRKKQFGELGIYISGMEQVFHNLNPGVETGNVYVDVIISDLSMQYADVLLLWTGRVPVLDMPYIDICTLFFNLLKNAYEAVQDTEDKKVEVIIKSMDVTLVVTVSNAYHKLIGDAASGFSTTKEGAGHGYGIHNIKECVGKYHGAYSVKLENQHFKTQIILPGIIGTVQK